MTDHIINTEEASLVSACLTHTLKKEGMSSDDDDDDDDAYAPADRSRPHAPCDPTD